MPRTERALSVVIRVSSSCLPPGSDFLNGKSSIALHMASLGSGDSCWRLTMTSVFSSSSMVAGPLGAHRRPTLPLPPNGSSTSVLLIGVLIGWAIRTPASSSDVAVALGLVEPQMVDFAPGVPQVLPFSSSESTGSCRHSLRRATEHQRLFLPDAGSREVETRLAEGLAEVQPLGVGMEHVDGGIVRHVGRGV